ncbi:MAG TPA: ABC transporter permease subunit [Verrucomicrobiae bacterium]|jgi:ABC-type transport system involved in cytochrome c biogenesis permease component|nr:ABC transporter permease subunit [Verrucomicrobiae bacterium]
MIFLPIVERELRVAARRGATFVWRSLMALCAIGIGIIVFLANFNQPDTVVGYAIFTGLAVLALVYCLFAGRLSTADCLSEEKREGTLGLLFLTDLTGNDVVLGKLAATSLNAFYGLLALFPVLALPLLMGGVAYTEFTRLVLVLLDTFLFSLAIGMFASSLTRDLRHAMAVNFAMLLALTLVIPCIGAAIAAWWHVIINPFGYTSPIYCFVLVFDRFYKPTPYNFWFSLFIIHGITWWLLYQAGRIVPHSWQDAPKPKPVTAKNKAPRQGWWHKWSYGPVEKLPAHRKKLLDVNAFFWLSSRARLKPMHVWVFLFLLGAWYFFLHITADGIVDDALDLMAALLLTTTLKLWLALEAGQQLARDKKSGALELLLSTPLNEHDIVRGQMLALRRQFFFPTIAVLILDLVLMYGALSFNKQHPDPQLGYIWMGSILMVPIDLIALSWFGMASALTAKNYNRSVMAAAGMLALPYLIFGVGTVIAEVWIDLTSSPPAFGSAFHPGWFFALSLVTDVFFGRRAYKQLFGGMRRMASQRFISATRAEAEIKPAKPKISRRKLALRWAVATAVIAVVAGYLSMDSPRHFPPPVIVPMSTGQGTLQVFPSSAGAIFILPDGTLWRFGKTGGNMDRAIVPEPFDTNRWTSVAAAPEDFIGIRDDGTLWQEPFRYGAPGGLSQLGSDHDWVKVSGVNSHGCAIKRDGSLWVWGNNQIGQLGIGPGPFQETPVQVGSDKNWSSTFCSGAATLAIRTDGTLWAWGRTFFISGFQYSSVANFATPTQVCRDTNWSDFPVTGMTIKVRNRAGELWEPFLLPPDALLGADATCRLACYAANSNRLAYAFCGEPTAFEIRTNGTLWRKEYTSGSTMIASTEKWQQVGKRADWVSLWGGGGTIYGLTTDGVLWTWGFDPTRTDEPDNFHESLRVFHLQILAAMGKASGGARFGMNRNAVWQYEKKPHAILRLTGAPSVASTP